MSTQTDTQTPPKWASLHDLAVDRTGGKVLHATDDFFAAKENMIKHAAPIRNNEFTENGKWMDGWESRRKRTGGHDIATIRLGLPGKISGVDFDTTFFSGNQPEEVKLEGIYYTVPRKSDGSLDEDAELAHVTNPDLEWQVVVPLSHTGPTCHNYHASTNTDTVFTHVRYHMYPDGGTARLRVYGTVVVDWKAKQTEDGLVDLAAFENGGLAIACSDEHFGKMNNLVMPGRGINMGDGWETRRRRGVGFDWVIIKLGTTGTVKKVIVDTAWFKGNFPHAVVVEAAFIEEGENPIYSLDFVPITEKTLTQSHHIHEFQVTSTNKVNHVRMCIFPDGGVSRLRVLGVKSD